MSHIFMANNAGLTVIDLMIHCHKSHGMLRWCKRHAATTYKQSEALHAHQQIPCAHWSRCSGSEVRQGRFRDKMGRISAASFIDFIVVLGTIKIHINLTSFAGNHYHSLQIVNNVSKRCRELCTVIGRFINFQILLSWETEKNSKSVTKRYTMNLQPFGKINKTKASFLWETML